MNYYEEVLAKINQLMETEKYDEALKLIDLELSMPYVPKDLETKLIDYRKAILTVITKTSESNFSGELIFSLLKNDNLSLDEKIGLLQKLEKVNLRNYLTDVEQFLNSENQNELKTVLIYLLANQEIDHEFSYKNSLQKVVINPKTYDFEKSELIPLELINHLEKILPHEYPQLLEMGKIVVANLYYKLFPINQPYDWQLMAEAVKERLLILNGINDQNDSNPKLAEYEKLLQDLEIL